ncbi:hypothetical protein Y1Q_0009252 [Alligator mississippiensis]|uniref:Uncharacterized protein n=1 Tax=Alligator mississippiensis TaxID=8496 RepID=A0A151M307_ALLMI|nr:hypothetical protein Y1Q_0009252 [Alligator mississippiensis]
MHGLNKYNHFSFSKCLTTILPYIISVRTGTELNLILKQHEPDRNNHAVQLPVRRGRIHDPRGRMGQRPASGPSMGETAKEGANKHEQSRVFPETIEEATLEIVIRYVNLE